MKCRNIVNGKECGVDLSPNANCCVECGEDVRTIECPKCSTTVKETQKFCLNCKWKVEENAFVNKTSPSNVTHEEVPADESVGGLQHVPLDNEGKCKTFCLIYQKHSIFFSTFEFYHEHLFIHLDSRRENKQLSFVIVILHETCHVKSSGKCEWNHYVIWSPVNFQTKIRVSIKEIKIFKICCVRGYYKLLHLYLYFPYMSLFNLHTKTHGNR